MKTDQPLCPKIRQNALPSLARIVARLIIWDCVVGCVSGDKEIYPEEIGFVRLPGDGKWVSVDFKRDGSDKTVVILGAARFEANNIFILTQVRNVSKKGFDARVVAESCEAKESADDKLFEVPWMAAETAFDGESNFVNLQYRDLFAARLPINLSDNTDWTGIFPIKFQPASQLDKDASYGVIAQLQDAPTAELIDDSCRTFIVGAEIIIGKELVRVRVSCLPKSLRHISAIVGMIVFRKGITLHGSITIQVAEVALGEALKQAHTYVPKPAVFAQQLIHPIVTAVYPFANYEGAKELGLLLSFFAQPVCAKASSYQSPRALVVLIEQAGDRPDNGGEEQETEHQRSDSEKSLAISADLPLKTERDWALVAGNMGPSCYKVLESPQNLSAEACTMVCLQLWKANMDTYARCKQRDTCFYKNLASKTALRPHVHKSCLSLAAKNLKSCKFRIRGPLRPDIQYEHQIFVTYQDVGRLGGWHFQTDHCSDGTEPKLVKALFGHQEDQEGDHEFTRSCAPIDISERLQALCTSILVSTGSGCQITLDTWLLWSVQLACAATGREMLGIFFVCSPREAKIQDACSPYDAATAPPTDGTCSCPNGKISCSFLEATEDSRWLSSLRSSSETITLREFTGIQAGKIRLWTKAPCDQYRNLCKTAKIAETSPIGIPAWTDWLNRGPDCYKPVDPNTGRLCTFACNILWKRVTEAAEKQEDPQAWWVNVWETVDFSRIKYFDLQAAALLPHCIFAQRNAFASLKQYEHELWHTNRQFRNPCPSKSKVDLVQVIAGCYTVLLEGMQSEDCRYLDLTEQTNQSCLDELNGEQGECILPESVLKLTMQACPFCQLEVGILWRWNCIRNTTSEIRGLSCKLLKTAGAVDNSVPAETPCECQNKAPLCSKEDSELDDSWKKDMPENATVLLSEGFAFVSDASGPYYKAFTPNDTVCRKDFVRALCADWEHRGEVVSPARDPNCKGAFSTRTTAGEFDHLACSVSCMDLLQNKCAAAANPWLCVTQNMLKTCAVPNARQETCKVSEVIGNFNEDNRTCFCPGNETPCTIEELRATAYDWQSDRVNFRKGLILLAGGKAMWPDGTILSEYGTDTSAACQNHRRYKGIFCTGKAGPPLSLKQGFTTDCAAASPRNYGEVTEYQCVYICNSIKTRCENLLKSNPDAYKGEPQCVLELAEKDQVSKFCTLTQKLIEPEPGAGNFEVGYYVEVREKWKQIEFKEIIDDPIVILGVPRATNRLGLAQVRNVTPKGFQVKYMTDICGEGFALPCTTVSWLAASAGRYIVSDSGTSVRVGQINVTVNSSATFSFIVPMKSPQPVVLAQIQHVPYEDADKCVPFAAVRSTSRSEAVISISSACTFSKEITVTVGIMAFDSLESCAKSDECQLNGRKFRTAVATAEVIGGTISESWTTPTPSPFLPMVFASVEKYGEFPLYVLSQQQRKSTRRSAAQSAIKSSLSVALFEQRNNVTFDVSHKLKTTAKRTGFSFIETSQQTQKTNAEPPAKVESPPIFVKTYKGPPAPVKRSAAAEVQLNEDGLLSQENSVDSPNFRLYGRDFSNVKNQAWRPVIDLFYADTCSKSPDFSSAPLETLEHVYVRVLYIRADQILGLEDTSACAALYPNCEHAKAKAEQNVTNADCKNACVHTATACGRFTEDVWGCFVQLFPSSLQRKCYITFGDVDISSNLEPSEESQIDPLANCQIVDLRDFEDQSFRGWDVRTNSCNCPSGLPACSHAQVSYDWKRWSKSLDTICGNSTSEVKPVTSGFKSPQESLCKTKSEGRRLIWVQRELPPYTADDVALPHLIVRSGTYICRNDINFVFCPGVPASTSTTTKSPSKPIEQQDCIPTEWTSWSSCSMICAENSQSVPLKVRRRSVLVPQQGGGEACMLLETLHCSVPEEVPLCEDICWRTEWSAWSACTEMLDQVGKSGFTARMRLQYLIMGGEQCNSDMGTPREYQPCQMNELAKRSAESGNGEALIDVNPPTNAQSSLSGTLFKQGTAFEVNSPEDKAVQKKEALEAAQLYQQNTVRKKCPQYLPWSSCTAPCQIEGLPPPIQYRLGVTEDASGQRQYCGLEKRNCADLKTLCTDDAVADCTKVTAGYLTDEETAKCQKYCETVVKQCQREAYSTGQTQWECALTRIATVADPQVAERCMYDSESVKARPVKPPACFLSGTRMASSESEHPFLKFGGSSGKGSCVCATPNAEPCTAEEVYRAKETWMPQLTTSVCPFITLTGSIDLSVNPASSDSSIYIAAADMSLIHCPLTRRPDVATSATFSSFDSPKKMNEFCRDGLPYWDIARDEHETVVVSSCKAAAAKSGSTTTDAECQKWCETAVQACRSDFLRFAECSRRAVTAPAFTKVCFLRQNTSAGKGLMFCKYLPVHCQFSNWQEWSSCSSTCRHEGGDYVDAYRYRRRKLVRGSEFEGLCEDSDGLRLVDAEFCTWLPPCEGSESWFSSSTTPSEPKIILNWNAPSSKPNSTTTTAAPPQEDRCRVVDMELYPIGRKYSSDYQSCTCPFNSSPCSSEEVIAHLPHWDIDNDICENDYFRNIYAQNGAEFRCSSGNFAPVPEHVATVDEDCQSQWNRYLFCTVELDSDFKGAIWLGASAVLLGALAGITVVCCILRYSANLRTEILGFSGVSNELDNMRASDVKTEESPVGQLEQSWNNDLSSFMNVTDELPAAIAASEATHESNEDNFFSAPNASETEF